MEDMETAAGSKSDGRDGSIGVSIQEPRVMTGGPGMAAIRVACQAMMALTDAALTNSMGGMRASVTCQGMTYTIEIVAAASALAHASTRPPRCSQHEGTGDGVVPKSHAILAGNRLQFRYNSEASALFVLPKLQFVLRYHRTSVQTLHTSECSLKYKQPLMPS